MNQRFTKNLKNALFSTENVFVQEDGLNLGSKFEYYLTKCEDVRSIR